MYEIISISIDLNAVEIKIFAKGKVELFGSKILHLVEK